MRVFYLIVLILCLSSQLTNCSIEDEFVDPLDMLNYDRSTKSMKRPKTVSSSENVPIENDRCTLFLSRFVNILLKNTGLSVSAFKIFIILNVHKYFTCWQLFQSFNYKPNENDNKELKSYASVTINVQDLKLLKNMAIKKDIDYMEIDRILNGMFTPVKQSLPEFEGTYSYLNTYYDQVSIIHFIRI